MRYSVASISPKKLRADHLTPGRFYIIALENPSGEVYFCVREGSAHPKLVVLSSGNIPNKNTVDAWDRQFGFYEVEPDDEIVFQMKHD